MKIKDKVLKRIFDFYVFSNIHVAFAAFSLTKITLVTNGISENRSSLFVFFATLFSYNLIRFVRLNSIKSWYAEWVKSNRRKLLFLSLLAFIVLVYLLFNIRFKALLVLLPFGLFTLFYTFPIKRFALREKPGFKLFIIAISWAGITVLFPLVQNYFQLRLEDYLVFIQRFLFVFAITIPFDIRDLNYDSKNMRTLPQTVGISNSKKIAIISILLFMIIDFMLDISNKIKVVDFVVVLMSMFFIYRSSTKKSKYYTSFVIEAIPILWVVLLYIF